MRLRWTARLVLAMAMVSGAPALGQSDASAQSAKKAITYDVVSIRPSKNRGPDDIDVSTNNNTFLAKNVSLKWLVSYAYEIREDLISAVTGPMEDARWDVEAKVIDADQKALGELSGSEHRALMRPVLEQRFHLKVHKETKTLPVYELVVAKGKTKLVAGADGHGGRSRVRGVRGGLELTAQSTSMSQFAELLAGEVRRTVIDKTGLAGTYDFGMTWSTEQQVEAGTASGVGIFTALEEQLGLKLQPGKGPVETLVVDHAEMPSAE